MILNSETSAGPLPMKPKTDLLGISLDKPGRYFLEGELSFASVEQGLKNTVKIFTASDRLVFDLAGITRVDSAGLALLLEWRKWAKEGEIALHYANLPRQLLAMAHVAGVDDILIVD